MHLPILTPSALLLSASSLLLAACGAGAAQDNTAADALPPPNIVWLVAEDISPRFAAYGDSLAHTPHIDALAREGVVFERAFTNSGVCAPSRASIITGCYPSSIGTQHMRQRPSVIPMPGPPAYNAVPPPEVKAFPELLREAGYWTASYRKLDYQFGEPFTIWDEVSDTPHWRHRGGADTARPFFVYHTYEITHEINIWPDSTKERFFEEFGLDTPRLAPDVFARPPFDERYAVDPDAVTVPPYLPDTRVGREHIARLYDNASRMDRQIGQVMADLAEDGLLESTIVFFLSDHGDCLPRAKRWVYESGTRIPLIVHVPEAYRTRLGWPARPAREERIVSGVDLAPTVLEMAGVEVPDWIQGYSLLSGPPRRYHFAARDRIDNRYDTRRAVRDERYRYVRNYRPEVPYSQYTTFLHQMPYMAQIVRLHEAGELPPRQAYWLEGPKPAEELYDVTRDPHEVHNLAGSEAYADTLDRLRTALEDWQEAYGDLLLEPETEQAERMWPGLEQPVTAAPEVVGRGGEVVATSRTEGASVAYRGPGEERWVPYVMPVADTAIAPGTAFKAVRYGYAESPAVEYGAGGEARTKDAPPR